jgi:hypothetical protein
MRCAKLSPLGLTKPKVFEWVGKRPSENKWVLCIVGAEIAGAI